jgi:hypothetical protein
LPQVLRLLDFVGKSNGVRNSNPCGRSQRHVVRDRVLAPSSSLFGALAASLAMIGLYGVIPTPPAAERRRLDCVWPGAEDHAVRYLVLRETIGLAGPGILIGMPSRLLLGSLLRPSYTV